MSQPEAKLTRAILDALQTAGVFAMRNAQSTSRTRGHPGLPKGSPDIVCVLPPSGTFFGIEVKVPGETLDKHQEEFHQALTRLGAPMVTVTSVTGAIAALNNIRQGRFRS